MIHAPLWIPGSQHARGPVAPAAPVLIAVAPRLAVSTAGLNAALASAAKPIRAAGLPILLSDDFAGLSESASVHGRTLNNALGGAQATDWDAAFGAGWVVGGSGGGCARISNGFGAGNLNPLPVQRAARLRIEFTVTVTWAFGPNFGVVFRRIWSNPFRYVYVQFTGATVRAAVYDSGIGEAFYTFDALTAPGDGVTAAIACEVEDIPGAGGGLRLTCEIDGLAQTLEVLTAGARANRAANYPSPPFTSGAFEGGIWSLSTTSSAQWVIRNYVQRGKDLL